MIYANVRSKRLAEWRGSQSHPLRSDDWVAGAQIGNLRTPPHWLDLNLANTQSRSGVIADALATIERLAIPYFERFDGLQTLFEYLMVHDLPGMEAPLPIEFLLCFGGRELAERYFHRFLRERPDISSQYRSCLEELRSNGLPKIFRSGYAIGLAYATVGYQLKSPDAT